MYPLELELDESELPELLDSESDEEDNELSPGCELEDSEASDSELMLELWISSELSEYDESDIV
jgi:hypothetical protein